VSRFIKACTAVLAVLALHLVAVPTAAHADPTRNPGCKSVRATQKYGTAGVTAYGQTRIFRFCWTGGTVTRSKVYNVTGDAECWSNAIFQDKNCKGPTDRNRVPIQSSQKFGGGSGNIYFWFQTRDCATGPLKILCSPWRWHGARYTIKQGGWFLADADV